MRGRNILTPSPFPFEMPKPHCEVESWPSCSMCSSTSQSQFPSSSVETSYFELPSSPPPAAESLLRKIQKSQLWKPGDFQSQFTSSSLFCLRLIASAVSRRIPVL